LRRFFVQNIFFLILINLVVKPLWIFGIDRNVQNAVGHEAYGQYGALFNFTVIFQVLLDFGLQSYNSRVVAQSPETMKSMLPNIMVAKIILSAVYLLLVAGLGLLMGYHGYAFFLLLLLSVVQILTSFLLYLRSNVSAMHKFKTDSLLSVSDRFFMIGICSVLLFHPYFSGRFKIEWFIYAQIAAYLVTAVIAFVVCARLSRIDWRHYDLRKVWAICKKSGPYALLIFLMAIYLRADMAIMERLLPNGKYEAGVYAAAYRFLDVANNISGVLFAGMLLPLFGRMLAKQEPVQPLLRLTVNLLLPIAITAVIAALLLGTAIMKANYHEATDYDGRVFALLMVAFPGFCIGYIYSTLLVAHGSIRLLTINSVIAVVINLGMNFILIPMYGAWAAALSCCVTQLFLSLININGVRRLMQLPRNYKWLGQYLLFTLIVAASGLGVLKLQVHLLLQLSLIAASGGIAMLICGFVPFKKIMELLSKK
jgi:O-antigen/teichoic acid export membrane protein